GEGDTEELGLRAGSGEPNVDVVAYEAAAGVEETRFEARLLGELGLDERGVELRRAVILQTVEHELGARRLHDPRDRVRPAGALAAVEEVHDDGELRPAGELDRDSRLHGEAG